MKIVPQPLLQPVGGAFGAQPYMPTSIYPFFDESGSSCFLHSKQPGGIRFANHPYYRPGQGTAQPPAEISLGVPDVQHLVSASAMNGSGGGRRWELVPENGVGVFVRPDMLADMLGHLRAHPGRLIIGRAEHADVVTLHRDLSREHAALSFDGEQFFIEDLGSLNGTTVNAVQLEPRVKTPLASGAHVGFAKRLYLHIPDALDGGALAPAERSPKAKSVDGEAVKRWVVEDTSFISPELSAEIITSLRRQPRRLFIGRGDDAHIVIRNNQISTRHAALSFDGKKFTIEDLRSANGTYLDGKRLTFGREVPLSLGMRLSFSKKISMVVVDDAEQFLAASRRSGSVSSSRAFGDTPEAAVRGEMMLSPAALELRDRVRAAPGRLFFTRNMGLAELVDIARRGVMRSEDGMGKYFRYGLSHEYGEIVVVMKDAFWNMASTSGDLEDIFLQSISRRDLILKVFGDDPSWMAFFVNPDEEDLQLKQNFDALLKSARFDDQRKSMMILWMHGLRLPEIKAFIKELLDPEARLDELREHIEYNQLLERREKDVLESISHFGGTVIGSGPRHFMGYYPQMWVRKDVPLDVVEAIMIPEHLWDETTKLLRRAKSRMRRLLVKVEGTGADRDAFLEGRERMGRRSRFFGGMLEPQFGERAFFLFEQAYFQMVLQRESGDVPELREARSEQRYEDRIAAAMKAHGYMPVPAHGWIFANPGHADGQKREGDDWKIFVNPREERFDEALGGVLEVLQQHSDLGIQLKVPSDLNAEWRPGRVFGTSSDTPKIVVYVDRETLPIIMRALDERLASLGPDAGFGTMPGPSFNRSYGATGMLFYKHEYFTGRQDDRVRLAREVELKAERSGISDVIFREDIAVEEFERVRSLFVDPETSELRLIPEASQEMLSSLSLSEDLHWMLGSALAQRDLILNLKREGLANAGFMGENFYRRSDEPDPLDEG